MPMVATIPWLKRLLLALAAVVATLVLFVTAAVIHSLYHPLPDGPRWSEPSGEPQVIAWLFVVGSLFFLSSYLLFSVPLVLLWPVRLQLHHWYGPLLAALLWPPLAEVVLLHRPPRVLLHDIVAHNLALVAAEASALVACTLYLVLLRGATQAATPST